MNKKIIQFFKKINKTKLEFNYIFFGIIFLFLLFLNIYHLSLIESSSWVVKSFFLSYTIGQLFLEMAFFLVLSVWIKKKAPKAIYFGYIALITFFLFVQIAEFILVRIMDVSFPEALDIVFGADFDNFIELLYLSDIGIMLWMIIFSFAILVPIIGVLFYRLTLNLSKKKPLGVRSGFFIKSFLFIPLVLLSFDFLVSYQLLNEDYVSHRKALPWKGTFLKENTKNLHLSSSFDLNIKLSDFFEDMKTTSFYPDQKPNIYIFVAESLREDFLNQDIAKHLLQFKREHISAQKACSSANGTHNSWFSIFYSIYPFYWSYKQNQHLKKGSPALYALKQMGYKIHAYTSAELKYYGFNKVIFGEGNYLCDSFNHFPHNGSEGADASDINALSALRTSIELDNKKNGQVFIVFLDSTHFTYSWPKEMKVPYPSVDKLDFSYYLTSDPSKIEFIKNRYKNSIYFIDNLFGDFVGFLKKKDLYNESIIVFTGDHGEEFKEHGKLFHASHLSSMQTRVPLYIKLGLYQHNRPIPIASHLDIFPTILHYLTSSEDLNQYFHGQSILSNHHRSFALTVRYNSCRHPFEFVLDDGMQRLFLRFPNSSIYRANKVKILALQDQYREIKPTKKQAFEMFSSALDELFNLKHD